MPLPDLSQNPSPELLFADILAYVEEAETLVEKRDPVSLAGLDTVVDALCQRITALEASAARAFLPKLEEVVARITGLQGKMLALQGDIATTIKSLNSTKKAASAYNNAPTGKREE